MTHDLTETLLHAIDVRHLMYFAVVAEEGSMRRAAERLFMTQPPLSRQIKRLEECLGVPLFVRHSKGLELTEEGANVLEIIRPLLALRDETFRRLREEIHRDCPTVRIGFTTAFEQGVFTALEAGLRKRYGKRLRILRSSSPRLVKEIRSGKLEAALVALPLEAPDLVVRETPYVEPLVAAIPEAWVRSKKVTANTFPLACFTDEPLFWFTRETNPAFFDFTKGRFALAGYAPRFIEEPAEHDVLLARITAGEGMGLFAASFAAIKRDGVVFIKVADGHMLHIQLGIAYLAENERISRMLEDDFPVQCITKS